MSAIGGEIVEHVAEIDIGHVAQRNQMRKADAARRRPVENRRQHRAGLRDESDMSLVAAGHVRRMRSDAHGVESTPMTIRSRRCATDGARGVEHRLLQRLAFCAAKLRRIRR